MAITAALIVAAGAAVSAGVGAAASSSAGKKGASAGASAAQSFTLAGQQANTILDDAQEKSLGLLKPYEEKLGNLPSIIAQTIKGNMDNLPNAKLLARRINSLNQSEIDRLLGRALPGVKEMVRLASNNTLSMLRGEVPADVAALVRRNSAQTALQGGFAGSESATALTARDLGTTSLNLMQEGSNSAQRWISTARSQLMPALFDPTTMLATPQLSLSSILAGAGIAKDQAEIINGTAARKAGILLQSTGAATQAQLQGDAAQIAGQKGSMDAIAKGIQGVTGAIGGMYMPTGAGGGAAGGSGSLFGGGGGSASTAIPASVYSGWQPGPQEGTYYMPKAA